MVGIEVELGWFFFLFFFFSRFFAISGDEVVGLGL